MFVRLCSDGLFDLANNVLDFTCILFSHAISFKIGVLDDLAGLLFDCACRFVKLACRLVLCAGFHYDSLLFAVIGFGSSRSFEISLRHEHLKQAATVFQRIAFAERQALQWLVSNGKVGNF